MMGRNLVAIMVGAALLAAAPAGAGGKKEGAGESGGSVVAPIAGELSGPREMLVPTEQASPSLGNLVVVATMMAGAGAGKCRMNFVMSNPTTAAIAMGAVATAINAKGEVTDNWALSIGSLPPNGQTARLFSCGLGAAKLILTPLPEFSWPPVKCAKPDQDPEACSLGMQIKSTLPLGDKNDIKESAPEPEKKH